MIDVFDEAAELYHAVRPKYPDTLFEAIATVAPSHARVLEIGIGTGQATLMLGRRGFHIVGLEPGPRLAAIARRNLAAYPSVTIEEVTFENWTVESGRFDVILSATAFHWVSPEARYTKTAQALAAGGHLALVWNFPCDEEYTPNSELQRVYERCIPNAGSEDRPLQVRIQSWTDAIGQSGLFAESSVQQVPWSEWYTTERYLMLLDTYSNHRNLPDVTKRCLYDGVAEVLEQNGGGIQKEYVAVLILAQKKRE